jgi:hypothetical protein
MGSVQLDGPYRERPKPYAEGGLLAKPVTFERLQGLDAPIFTGESLTASGILLISLFIGAFRGMLRHRPGKR